MNNRLNHCIAKTDSSATEYDTTLLSIYDPLGGYRIETETNTAQPHQTDRCRLDDVTGWLRSSTAPGR